MVVGFLVSLYDTTANCLAQLIGSKLSNKMKAYWNIGIYSLLIQKSFPFPARGRQRTALLMGRRRMVALIADCGNAYRIHNFRVVGRMSGCDWHNGAGVVERSTVGISVQFLFTAAV